MEWWKELYVNITPLSILKDEHPARVQEPIPPSNSDSQVYTMPHSVILQPHRSYQLFLKTKISVLH